MLNFTIRKFCENSTFSSRFLSIWLAFQVSPFVGSTNDAISCLVSFRKWIEEPHTCSPFLRDDDNHRPVVFNWHSDIRVLVCGFVLRSFAPSKREQRNQTGKSYRCSGEANHHNSLFNTFDLSRSMYRFVSIQFDSQR